MYHFHKLEWSSHIKSKMPRNVNTFLIQIAFKLVRYFEFFSPERRRQSLLSTLKMQFTVCLENKKNRFLDRNEVFYELKIFIFIYGPLTFQDRSIIEMSEGQKLSIIFQNSVCKNLGFKCHTFISSSNLLSIPFLLEKNSLKQFHWGEEKWTLLKLIGAHFKFNIDSLSGEVGCIEDLASKEWKKENISNSVHESYTNSMFFERTHFQTLFYDIDQKVKTWLVSKVWYGRAKIPNEGI